MPPEPKTKNFIDLLQDFKRIDLEEFNKIRLPFRTDTKYVTKLGKLSAVLADLREEYLLLEIDGRTLSPYETEYFDTHAFSLYLMHHNGKLNRFKVRRRTYLTSGLSFLEIKFKSNKGKTSKKRQKLPGRAVVLNDSLQSFIEKYTMKKAGELKSKVILRYQRIALAHRESAERVSIDLCLSFNNESKTGSIPDLVIIEVKQHRYDNNSHIMQVLRKYRIKPFRLSKYCLAVCHLYDFVKKNRMKEKMINLKKHLR